MAINLRLTRSQTLHTLNMLLYNEQLESPHRRDALQKLEAFLDQRRAMRSSIALDMSSTGESKTVRHRLPKPWPGATPVLERPYPKISGRRHIPKLVWANGIPMLRFKKPQSTFLSRIITSKIKQKDRSITSFHELEHFIDLAMMEDTWDEILRREFGAVITKLSEQDGSWAQELLYTKQERHEALVAATEKTQQLAEKMHEIVLAEKRLAAEEEAQRRRENRAKKHGPRSPSAEPLEAGT